MNKALQSLAEIRIICARLETVGYICAAEIPEEVIGKDTEELAAIAKRMQEIYGRWRNNGLY